MLFFGPCAPSNFLPSGDGVPPKPIGRGRRDLFQKRAAVCRNEATPKEALVDRRTKQALKTRLAFWHCTCSDFRSHYMTADRFLRPGEAEILKGAVHAAVCGLAVICGVYNTAA